LVALKRYLVVILFFLLSFSGWTQEREFQIRNINNVEVKTGKVTSVALYSRDYYTPRTGYNNLAFFGDFSGEFDVNKWLEVGAAGRVMGYKRDYGWEMEQRPMIFGNLTAMLGKAEIELANRFEYRIIKDLNDYIRYKQVLSMEVIPFNFSWLILFAAEEGFYLFNSERFNRSRLSVGTRIKYNSTFEMKLYYMLEKNKMNPGWDSVDILGLNMYFDF